MSTFMERYLRGEVTAEEIDDYVELWHESLGFSGELHEYLGMTWEEYGAWAETPSVLPGLRDARLSQS